MKWKQTYDFQFCLDDIHWDKGACGRNKHTNTYEMYDVSVLLTMFTRKARLQPLEQTSNKSMDQ